MLNYDIARHCYSLILESESTALRRELFQKALEYARIRAQWMVMSIEQKKEMNQRRTLAHNSFIDACNIMSRNMAKNDEDNSWRAYLGDDVEIIGDFACYIHYFLAMPDEYHCQKLSTLSY